MFIAEILCVKAAWEHYKVIGGGPLSAGKVLEVLAGSNTPGTIVRSNFTHLPSQSHCCFDLLSWFLRLTASLKYVLLSISSHLFCYSTPYIPALYTKNHTSGDTITGRTTWETAIHQAGGEWNQDASHAGMQTPFNTTLKDVLCSLHRVEFARWNVMKLNYTAFVAPATGEAVKDISSPLKTRVLS